METMKRRVREEMERGTKEKEKRKKEEERKD